ncbi:XRE family transcriptional regulator [Streptomyces sp. NPDC049881]|uniref:XRE family transcriptional regulator n=1 Tax=Streptomyces sp. NPDC049881 TaxID=3155778 RepID=UPI003437E44B
MSSSQLDLLEERFNSLRLQYTTTAPALMLSHLLEELQEVEALANDRQPAAVQLRLSEMTAVLSTLVADALMKLGRLRQSRAWYDTARTAADDAQNADTRARVRAQAAMLPYYYGPLEDALRLTREARLLSRGQPSATSAFAAIADARALARQGNAGAARAAITAARHDFDRAQHGNPDDAFAFPYRRLLLYLSGAYTSLGMTSQAHAVQAEALKLYGDHPGIDPVLLKLEQAICLVRERSLSDACQLASAAYLRVPEDHRTRILGTRARNIIDAVPPSQRSARPVQALGEVLELPSGRS